jgi:hypothetical protein
VHVRKQESGGASVRRQAVGASVSELREGHPSFAGVEADERGEQNLLATAGGDQPAGASPTLLLVYDVDSRDHVIPLSDIPQSSIGAPIPLVVANEHEALVAYLVDETGSEWDGMTVRIVGPASDAPAALVHFRGVAAMYLGSPNDEAFSGHPLASRGLHPYSASRIEHSSWIRRLESMNSVYPHHRPDAFRELTHVVLAFHDTTFECVARAYSAELMDGPISAIATEMTRRLA